MRSIPRTRGWGLALAFVTACISGTAIYVNATVVGSVGDATVYTTAKNGVAALILLAAFLGIRLLHRARPTESSPTKPTSRQRLGLVALGIIGGSIPFVLFFEGLARASVGAHAGFIHKTLIIWVAILAVPLLKERLTAFHIGAIGLLIVGQGILVSDLGSLRLGSGELMVLIATLFWSVEFVVAKRLLSTFDSATVGTSRLGFGIVALLIYVVVTGRADLFAAMTAQQWGWALLTGVILSGFVASWYAALARAQAVDVTAVLVFGQVVTASLSGVLKGAAFPALGMSLLIAGVIAGTIGAMRAARAEPVAA